MWTCRLGWVREGGWISPEPPRTRAPARRREPCICQRQIRKAEPRGIIGAEPLGIDGTPLLCSGVHLHKRGSQQAESLFCGDGRTRTAVQTPYPIAFYTLILPLIVGNGMPEDGLVRNLSSESWRALKESTRASGLDDTPYAMKDRPES